MTAAGRWPWFELNVPNPAQGVAFYGAVLGWEATSMDMGGTPYHMMGPPGGAQGCGVVTPEGGGGAQWVGYITVSSVDEAAARAAAAGGQVVVPAMDVPTVGRMACVVDPEGATFWLFTPEQADGSGNHAPGFYWMELHSDDPEAAAAFYAKVVGVGIDTMPMSGGTYFLLEGPERAASGICAKMMNGAPSMWLAWASVDNADAALERAVAAGGQVLAPAFDVEGIGRMGILQDDQGVVLGVITPAPRAA